MMKVVSIAVAPANAGPSVLAFEVFQKKSLGPGLRRGDESERTCFH